MALQFSGLPLIVAQNLDIILFRFKGINVCDMVFQDKYYFKVDLRCGGK